MGAKPTLLEVPHHLMDDVVQGIFMQVHYLREKSQSLEIMHPDDRVALAERYIDLATFATTLEGGDGK